MLRIQPLPTLRIRGPIEPLSLIRACVKALRRNEMNRSAEQLQKLVVEANDADDLLEICQQFIIVTIK